MASADRTATYIVDHNTLQAIANAIKTPSDTAVMKLSEFSSRIKQRAIDYSNVLYYSNDLPSGTTDITGSITYIPPKTLVVAEMDSNAAPAYLYFAAGNSTHHFSKLEKKYIFLNNTDEELHITGFAYANEWDLGDSNPVSSVVLYMYSI